MRAMNGAFEEGGSEIRKLGARKV